MPLQNQMILFFIHDSLDVNQIPLNAYQEITFHLSLWYELIDLPAYLHVLTSLFKIRSHMLSFYFMSFNTGDHGSPRLPVRIL